jgi:hypothetical protein
MERSMAHFVHCVEVYIPRHSPIFWRIKTLSFFSLIQKGRTKSRCVTLCFLRSKCAKCYIWIMSCDQMEVLLRDEIEFCGLEITKEWVARECRLQEKQDVKAQNACLSSPRFCSKTSGYSRWLLFFGAGDFKTRNAKNYVCAVAFEMQYLQDYGWTCCEGIKTSTICNEEL